jgi:hypothetical protein
MSGLDQHTKRAMDQSIQRCAECHHLCIRTVHDRLKRGGEEANHKYLSLLLDCASICRTAEDFMLRPSHLHQITCLACAEICVRCAECCEEMGDAECAEACRRCAESCRAMVA